MAKQIINSTNAPAPVGPYNQAVRAAGMLYMSGQIAIDPASGELVTSNITDETAQVFANMRAVLKAAQLDFNAIVKCTIFVKNMDDYAAINAKYAEYFDEATAPARELVEVVRLPKNVNIEISAIALAE